MNSIPFGTYVRLYTLHQIEQPPDVLLWMRIAVLRYSLAPLDRPTVDAAYASDPREGALVVRQSVLPRLLTLLDSRDPLAELNQTAGKMSPGGSTRAARRPGGAGARPGHSPVPHARMRRGAWSRPATRLSAPELIQTAAETTAGRWQPCGRTGRRRERRKLIETQRLLLQDSIQTQLAVQDDALQRAGPGYARLSGSTRGDPAAALLEQPDPAPD